MEILSQWKCYPNFVRHEPDAVPIHAVSGPFRHHIDAIAYKKEETMLPQGTQYVVSETLLCQVPGQRSLRPVSDAVVGDTVVQ